MLAVAWNSPEPVILPLTIAVFCLDCEVISNSRCDECPACKGHSLVSLARLLGGSLLEHDASQQIDSVSFDVRLTVEMQRMQAKDLSTTLESLNNVVGPRIAQGRGSFHINVEPITGKLLSRMGL
jgi:hypothetical protein